MCVIPSEMHCNLPFMIIQVKAIRCPFHTSLYLLEVSNWPTNMCSMLYLRRFKYEHKPSFLSFLHIATTYVFLTSYFPSAWVNKYIYSFLSSFLQSWAGLEQAIYSGFSNRLTTICNDKELAKAKMFRFQWFIDCSEIVC